MKLNEAKVGTIILTKKNPYGIKGNVKGIIREVSRPGVADIELENEPGHVLSKFPVSCLKKVSNQNQQLFNKDIKNN